MTAADVIAAHHGIADSLPFDQYLAIDALSAGSARKLLPPSCPALYRQEQLTPTRTRSMDFGKIAHAAILEGLNVHDLAAAVPGDWRTKGPKAEKEAVEQSGLIALHTGDWEAANGMVAAIRQNRMAAALFDPENGKPEQSMLWTDPRSGVKRKGRPDFLPARRTSGRLIVPDYKTTVESADASTYGRTAVNFGYPQQLAGYEEGVLELGLDDDPLFVLVVQEIRAPYLVNVLQIPDEAMRIARELNRWACNVYADCVERGTWPGYSNEVELLDIPGWWLKRWQELGK